MDRIKPIKYAISSVISNEGKSVLNNEVKFENCLRNYLKNEQSILQVIYILKASHINRYINKDTLTFVEINNIIIDTENATDIKRYVIEQYIYAILESSGYKINIPALKAETDFESQSGGSFVAEDYSKELFEVQDAIATVLNVDSKESPSAFEKSAKEKALDTIFENSQALKKACDQNNGWAYYLMAECYSNGITVTKSYELSFKYLKLAYKFGDPSASSLLGDVYFFKERYTDAYNYYTQIGAAAADDDSKINLINILNSRKTNIKAFALSVISYVLILVFDVIFMKGTFCPSACTHYPSGIISIIVSTVVLAVLSYFAFKKKYDMPKYSLSAMTVLFCITTFCALAF